MSNPFSTPPNSGARASGPTSGTRRALFRSCRPYPV
jgi:hypothetical protein